MSSTEEVKSTSSSGLSEKVIRKNSSCGLAVRKNSTTAWRDLSILSAIEPLMSKMTPSEIGASSLEKWRISCGLPLSVSCEVFFLQPGDQPVHGVGDGHRNQHQIHVFAQWLGVGLQAGIAIGRDVGRRRGVGLLGFARDDVHIIVLRQAGAVEPASRHKPRSSRKR